VRIIQVGVLGQLRLQPLDEGLVLVGDLDVLYIAVL
jgi:hypothetical protein